jgi:hypothetical protein
MEKVRRRRDGRGRVVRGDPAARRRSWKATSTRSPCSAVSRLGRCVTTICGPRSRRCWGSPPSGSRQRGEPRSGPCARPRPPLTPCEGGPGARTWRCIRTCWRRFRRLPRWGIRNPISSRRIREIPPQARGSSHSGSGLLPRDRAVPAHPRTGGGHPYSAAMRSPTCGPSSQTRESFRARVGDQPGIEVFPAPWLCVRFGPGGRVAGVAWGGDRRR